MKLLLDLVQHHKSGRAVGLYSVCSAHPVVIEAAFLDGLNGTGPVLIEATSNQVNQFGGYTGMTPRAFREFVFAIADKAGFPRERVLLGGDHLGPNCWQHEAAEVAMAKSETLIADYIAAGFRKIHLDCSMSCAGDPVPLTDDDVAARAARLCAVAEITWKKVGGEAPVYVIGTEVPVPGGAHEELGELAVTGQQAAQQTIIVHENSFADCGLQQAWKRVIGLVVQPGVEFDHHKVIAYQPEKAAGLSRLIESQPGIIFEAHSTDYQTAANLKNLVRDHFALLKVGPALTYALRETLWALADIERELLGVAGSSHFKQVVMAAMKKNPVHWSKYYTNESTLDLDLQFSLSDRLRYYWNDPDIQNAQSTLLTNLTRKPLPLTLLSQYLPHQYQLIGQGKMASRPDSILCEGVARVLRQYRHACSPEYNRESMELENHVYG